MTRLPFDGEAYWIWTQDTDRLEPGTIACTAQFQRSFDAPPHASLLIHVSADSQYILWLNGQKIGRGPAKGDPKHWPYDTYDLSAKLQSGTNILTAVVICFAPTWPDYRRGGAPVSIMSTAPGFILDGIVQDQTGAFIEHLATNEKWTAAPYPHLHLARRAGISCAGPGEEFVWNDTSEKMDIPALAITQGVRPDTAVDSMRAHRLIPRRIPFLPEIPKKFHSVWNVQGFSTPHAETAALNGQCLTVLPHTHAELLYDAGAITSGYPQLTIEGEGIIRLYYGEKLTHQDRIVRDPAQAHDPLTGPMWDQITLKKGSLSWEPVFWRAFRFLRLEICAGSQPLTMRFAGFNYTAYPYATYPLFSSSDPLHEPMDEVAWRTLQLCSHETFEDCPTREQLQYAGDVHVQARTAYWMAGDTLLARQAMLHFAESLNEEGLTASRYPSRVPQLIPVWSLHWILSLKEYYLYSADTQTVQYCLPAAMQVIHWFFKHRNPEGLIGRLPYWTFADWCPAWPNGGTPPGMECGTSAFINFMFIAVLRAIATLQETVVQDPSFISYHQEADKLARLTHAAFWEESLGLYRDRPEQPSEISQLTNAWGILSGTAPDALIPVIAENMVSHQGLCPSAWFGRTFVFDALLLAGKHHLAEDLLHPFRTLLTLGLTAWPESLELNGCSECHGWSNLPGLAFRQLYLGVSSETPGCSKIHIAPWLGSLATARGVVALPQGPLGVSWTKDSESLRVEISVPDGVTGTLTLPDGQTHDFSSGQNIFDSSSIPIPTPALSAR